MKNKKPHTHTLQHRTQNGQSAKQSTRQRTADKMQMHQQLPGQTKCAHVHSDASIASDAHALFGSVMIYTTTRANYESTVRTY